MCFQLKKTSKLFPPHPFSKNDNTCAITYRHAYFSNNTIRDTEVNIEFYSISLLFYHLVFIFIRVTYEHTSILKDTNNFIKHIMKISSDFFPFPSNFLSLLSLATSTFNYLALCLYLLSSF